MNNESWSAYQLYTAYGVGELYGDGHDYADDQDKDSQLGSKWVGERQGWLKQEN